MRHFRSRDLLFRIVRVSHPSPHASPLLRRAQAMSYVSPRAMLNQLFGAPAPGVAEAAEDRVKQFKKYIRDMEKR